MRKLSGFIKIHRKLVQWGWYKDNAVKCVFLHALLTANFKDVPWQNTVIKRGQLVTSVKRLSEELGFTPKQIRTALNKLKSTNELTIETTNKYTLLTVVNWESYQTAEEKKASKKASGEEIEGQTKGKRGANKGQQMKNDKECKERKEASPGPQIPEGFASREEYEAHIADLRR